MLNFLDQQHPNSGPSITFPRSLSKMLFNSNRGFVQLLLVSLRPLPPPPLLPFLPPPHACFLISLAACFRLELHSSYARPAPNPAPTNAGHALRLNRSTEKTTPKPRPRDDLMMALDRQKSHCFACQLLFIDRSSPGEGFRGVGPGVQD